MKNKYFSFVALAAAALATSCASDDLAEQKQEQTDTRTVTLTASVNEGQTRVGMTKNDSKASFYWHKGDAISVLTTTGSFVKFTTEDETGKASATFTGEVTGTISRYAVYPYNESNAVSNNKFACNLSDSYTYTSVGSNIFSKDDSYPSNPTNMPMLGTIADGKISFKCLGGLAVIRIDQMPAESGTLTVTADQQLSGAFYVNWSNPAVIATTSTDVNDADKKVTFNFTGASTTGAGVFYLPLATGSYTNLTIKISDSNGENTQTIPYGSLTVERAHVTAIPLSTDSKGNLRHIVDNGNGSYTINGHKFVDLGLSVLWAETNIGAETAYDDGNYYAWGETSPKDSYTEENYTYTNNLTTLDATHDAATANWGSAIRMPTMTEHGELLDGCSWEWKDMTNSANETIICYKGVNKNNSDIVIYLPASGSYDDGYICYRNIFGYYWSITPDETDKAYARAFKINNYGYPNSSYYATCYEGCSVRAVAEKPTTTE